MRTKSERLMEEASRSISGLQGGEVRQQNDENACLLGRAPNAGRHMLLSKYCEPGEGARLAAATSWDRSDSFLGGTSRENVLGTSWELNGTKIGWNPPPQKGRKVSASFYLLTLERAPKRLDHGSGSQEVGYIYFQDVL